MVIIMACVRIPCENRRKRKTAITNKDARSTAAKEMKPAQDETWDAWSSDLDKLVRDEPPSFTYRYTSRRVRYNSPQNFVVTLGEVRQTNKKGKNILNLA